MQTPRPLRILPLIVFAQFAGTSLWFAGNAVLPQMQELLGYPESALSWLTSAVQLGFILGTLVFAFLNIADRFSPVKVFLVCSLAGALSTLIWIPLAPNFSLTIGLRFSTGFFLAGIYPVGMKIAAGWFPEGLGKALGFLVGALVLGTAFPHLLQASGTQLPWETVILIVSALSASGGLAMLFGVPDGPHTTRSSKFDPSALVRCFQLKAFRRAAFGYFGHMWELYAFWAFVPTVLIAYTTAQSLEINISLWSFLIVAIGSLGCILGGFISLKRGSAWVAFANLASSALLCLLSPLLFEAHPLIFFSAYLLWGFTVVGDSPQFSSLSAQTAPKELIGTGLTIVNSIGFAITIFSIQLIGWLSQIVAPQYWMIALVIGPLIGLWQIGPALSKKD